MSALAKNTPRRHHAAVVESQKSYVVADGDEIFFGAMVGVYKTGAKTGYLGPYTVVTGNAMQWLGFAQKYVLGDGVKLCPVNCGGIELLDVDVTGVSSIVNVQNAKVYALNDNDLSTSAPAAGGVVGHVSKYYNGTKCDVRFYSAEAYEAASST
jgi:hypothetical protein